MNTAEMVSTEVCGTILLLGAGFLAIARQALRDSWVRYSVTFATVPRSKRFDWPKADAQKAPETSGGVAADEPAPAAPPDPARPLRKAPAA